MTRPITTETTEFGKGFPRDAWYFVDLGRAIRPGTQGRRMILGEPVLVGRTRAGRIFALRDVCPHRAAPLSAGRLVEHQGEGETVECPYHGWRFHTDGVCAAIPSVVDDDMIEPGRVRVRAYPVRESQGMVLVWMSSDPRGGDEPDHEPPRFPGAEGRARLVETLTVDGEVGRPVLAGAGFSPPGYHWSPVAMGGGRGLLLTCLTPLDDARTRIDRILWSDHWVMAVAGPLLRFGALGWLKPTDGPGG